jgi:hypothetical protein
MPLARRAFCGDSETKRRCRLGRPMKIKAGGHRVWRNFRAISGDGSVGSARRGR